MTPEQVLERGRQAAEAYDQFVGPALEDARAEYLAALTKIAATEPWETARITKLAVAMKVIDLVEQQIRAAMAGGRQAAHSLERARQIESIPEVRRNMLQRMGMTP